MGSDQPAGAARRARLEQARLYLIAEAAVAGRGTHEWLPEVIEAGVDVFQLRDKGLGDTDLLEAARRIGGVCSAGSALFIVNDRPDLALAAGADGVHLGQEDLDPEQAREVVGPGLLIGISTHSPEQIAAATDSAADYIGVGPVHETPTKPGRPAVGLQLVRHAAAHAGKPFFAIGGIAPSNAAAVVAAGAERIAVVRAIRDAEDRSGAARALRTALEGVRAGAAA
jgi:thiamine-phosphate pyrophosphorylase